MILCGLIAASQAIVVVQCIFSGYPGDTHPSYFYTCTINNTVITDPNEEVLIARLHLNGGTDANVRQVEFTNSQLSHIPNEFFDAFRGLYHIGAQWINLTSVGELRNCGNLQLLDIRQNQLTALPASSISACSNLITIYANNNQITEIEPGLLLNFAKLQTFSIGNNKIRRIDGSFNKTSNFDLLDFQNCKINAIDPDFLKDIKGSVATLNLVGNECINVELTGINSATVEGIKPFLFNCFRNFAPTPPPPTTEQPPLVGKMICKLDIFKKFYNCETRVNLEVIEDKMKARK